MKKLAYVTLFLLIPSFALGQGKHFLRQAQHLSSKTAGSIRQKSAQRLIDPEEKSLNQLSAELGIRIKERVQSGRQKARTRTLKEEMARKQEETARQTAAERFHLHTVITNIVQRHPDNIMDGLYEMRKLRKKRGDTANPAYFKTFASVYYKQHLNVLTPHIDALFSRVANLGYNSLETDVILRMEELFSKQKELLSIGLSNGSKKNLRLRYLKDIGTLNDLNFDPDSFIFAYEQSLYALSAQGGIRHISPLTQIYIGRDKIPLAHYNYDLAYVTELYKQLLTENGKADGISVVFDPEKRIMMMYAPHKQVWIRLTPHEFASTSNIHLHLNEVRTISFLTKQGKRITESVLFNIYIPIKEESARMIWHGKYYNLYEKMVLEPINSLKKENNVTITEGHLF